MYTRLRTALLNEYDHLIAVDWRGGSHNAFYPQSAANTVVVGREVALLIQKLNLCCEIDVNDVHVIGFSLGAHVSENLLLLLSTSLHNFGAKYSESRNVYCATLLPVLF